MPIKKVGVKASLVGPVILTKKTVFIDNLGGDEWLSSLLGTLQHSKTAIALPILSTNSSAIFGAVILINKKNNDSIIGFTSEDETKLSSHIDLLASAITSSLRFQGLGTKERKASSLASHNHVLYEKATKEAKVNRVMLELASFLFGEDDIKELCAKILRSAQDLVCSDKSSLFVVSEDQTELISAVFDTKSENTFKISINSGISGYVARSGQILNITDAYSDPRFYPEMDKKTGYVTRSILCVPIPGPDSRIVGVVNLINKLHTDKSVISFDEEDEKMSKSFATFCGLALHKTILLEEIKKKKAQLEVNMDLMSYHASAHIEDVEKFISTIPKSPITTEQLKQFDFDPSICSPDELCVVVAQMLNDLGYLEKYKIDQKMCFNYVLTIRKNYRKVSYHNYNHAVSVMHSIYLLIHHTKVKNLFEDHELFSILLAALNHDIDHRGTNNAFQKSADNALAHFYSTSTMERHHFNHALSILRTPGHNMFAAMNSEQYAVCLKSIEKSILATDLALYFGNKGKIKALIETKQFDFNNPVHIELCRGIVMTCSDLIAMTKSWENSRKTADTVYQEFFFQGDEEIKLGIPISAPLFDRSNIHKIPSMQDGFFTGIVIPAYELMAGILPETLPLLESTKDNHLKWKEIAASGVAYELAPTQ